jgi:hypothetical protein
LIKYRRAGGINESRPSLPEYGEKEAKCDEAMAEALICHILATIEDAEAAARPTGFAWRQVADFPRLLTR